MSRLYVFPSNDTASTPAYATSRAPCNVELYAQTAMTRPPEVTSLSPAIVVPAWKTTTSEQFEITVQADTVVPSTWRLCGRNFDRLALFISARVPLRSKDHRDCESRFERECHRVKAMFNTCLRIVRTHQYVAVRKGQYLP